MRPLLTQLTLTLLVACHMGAVTSPAPELPLRVSAAAAPRQTFKGFGWSLVRGGGTSYHGPLGNFSADVREQILTLLCEDLGTTVVRLWWTPNDAPGAAGWQPGDNLTFGGDSAFLDGYVNSGVVADLRRHGVTQLLLAPDRPCAPGAENATAGGHNVTLRADQTAEFIRTLQRDHNVTIDVTGVANEPGCWVKWQNKTSGATIMADWPRVNDTTGNMVTAVTALSQNLQALGLEHVKIIGPESSNADAHGLAAVKACAGDAACWAALDSIASHSYGMAANKAWANATEMSKGYWVTEVGAFAGIDSPMVFPGIGGRYQGVTLAARFLNDLNHMVDTWVWFIGAWIYDTQMLGGKTNCEKGCGAKCGETECGITRQEDMKLICA